MLVLCSAKSTESVSSPSSKVLCLKNPSLGTSVPFEYNFDKLGLDGVSIASLVEQTSTFASGNHTIFNYRTLEAESLFEAAGESNLMLRTFKSPCISSPNSCNNITVRAVEIYNNKVFDLLGDYGSEKLTSNK